MILERKASLFVIYDGDVPIGVTLNFLSEEVLVDTITVFDIDYAKFHLGSVSIMKLIEWCLENDYKVLDFSKGHYIYKTRWSNLKYHYNYHLLYDSKSLKSKLLSYGIRKYFQLKRVLREMELNELFHKLFFMLKFPFGNNSDSTEYNYKEVEENSNPDDLVELNLSTSENGFLRPAIFEFLYQRNESIKDLKVYRIGNNHSLFHFKGKMSTANFSISK